MINILENKFKKKVTIGDYQFDIAINRKMSAEAFGKFPKYWEAVTRSSLFEQTMQSMKNTDVEKVDEEKITKNITDEILDNIENADTQQLADYIILEADIQESGFEIIDYLLPQMMKYADEYNAKTDQEYREYADNVLQFCYDNNILFNYFDEEENPHKGVVTALMEFVTKGFTVGGKKKKSAVKVVIE